MSTATMNRLVLKLLGATIVAVVIWQLFAYRIPLANWFWHLRHDSIVVNGYVVPVPRGWYVSDVDPQVHMLVRMVTDDKSPTKRIKAHAGITIFQGVRTLTEQQLPRKVAMDAAVAQDQGAKLPQTRSFNIGDSVLVCVGGGQLSSGGIYDSEPHTWICRTTSGLEIRILSPASDMDAVWQILSGIHKAA